MGKVRIFACSCFAVVGVALLIGCSAAQPDKKVQHIPGITKLVEKATTPAPVHRFRKPVRDQRDRLLAELTIECDRLAESLRTQPVEAQALTGTLPEECQAATVDTGSLETALERLGGAAWEGNVREIRTAHSTALTAYIGLQGR